MRFPTLKDPRSCLITMCVIIAMVGLIPLLLFLVVCWQPNIPDWVHYLAVPILFLPPLIWLLREFSTLFLVDIILSTLDSYQTARTQFPLPPQQALTRIEKRICQYGRTFPPLPQQLQPAVLRYRFSAPWTVFSCGIERVVACYHIDLLDESTYRAIFDSAIANSKALKGKKKALFLDKEQKQQPLHRATVIFIFAARVDPRLVGSLYQLVCQKEGDKKTDAILPCVIDISRGVCTFNSLRVSSSYSIPVKNRGIRMIRRIVFGGRLPLKDNPHHVQRPEFADLDTEQSLWAFWCSTHNSFHQEKTQTNKKLKQMSDWEIDLQDDTLYMKWRNKGLCLMAGQDPMTHTVTLEEPKWWSYPKIDSISKRTVPQLKQALNDYFKKQGYSVVYIDFPQND